MTLLTEVIEDTPNGYAGQLWSSYPHAMDTRIAEETILPGRLITTVGKTLDKGVLLPTTSAGVTTVGATGISHFNTAKSEVTSDYADREPLTRITQGRVWVDVEDAVSDGDGVFVRFQAGILGAFRSDTDTGDAVQLPGAVYRSDTAGAGLAVVEINSP